VNRAAVTVSGEEFREGGMKVVRNEWCNDIFVTIRNDEEVASACGHEVIPPARTGKYTRLRTIGAGGLS